MASSCRLSGSEKPSGSSGPETSGFRFPVVTVLTLAVAAGILYWGHTNPGIVIATLSLTTISLIIYGERFAFDRALEKWGLPGRDAVLAAIALSLALAMGAVQPSVIPEVVHSKLQIIILILSFAILSEGISRSGFFASPLTRSSITVTAIRRRSRFICIS